MTVTVHVCGRLRVDWDGVRVEQLLAGPQLQLLFAYLILHRDRPVRRDELVEALWSDSANTDGDALLRPLLSRLRRALGPDRLEGRATLAVRFPPDTWIDLEAVRAGLGRARRAGAAGDHAQAWKAARAAIDAAGSGLLLGLEAAWLDPIRSELDALRAHLLETAALAGARLGPADVAEAELLARRAVELSPYRESARAALMAVLRRRGNTAEALVAYDEIRRLLLDELGSSPGPELRALHDELLRDERAAPVPALAPAGPSPLPDRLTQAAASAWVGRDDTLARLRAAAERAAAGHAGVVLVTGHGGMGKTRLVAELATTLDGFDVLYGRCEEEQVFPYGPWRELLRHRLDGLPAGEIAELAGAMAPSVARLIPELRDQLGEGAVEPVLGDPETERRQLFVAITRIVARLAARRPLLLVLDDLHWVDRSSLLLARHVAGEPRLGRVLLLGTVRDGELAPGHPLPDLLADLERHRDVLRIPLDGMPDHEVAALIGSLHASAVPAQTVRAIRAQTGGNPFFVRQLVRHLEEARGGLALDDAPDGDGLGVPEGVRDVIARRVGRLPAGAGGVLQVAALIGHEFGFDLLAGVTDLGREPLLDVLDAAVRSGLLVEVAAGRYAFAHALVRATLRAELSQTRRALTHRRIGEAIEARHADRLGPWLADLARHFGAAGAERAPTAIRYAERAAAQATGRLAYDEAAQLLHRAVTLYTATQDPPDPAELARLEHALASAEARAGHWETARASFARSAAAARAAGDPEAFARAALGHAGGTWEQWGTGNHESVTLMEEALAGLGSEDSALRVRVLAKSAEVHYNVGGPEERAAEAAFDAVAMARRVADPGALTAALLATQYALWGPGRARERLPLADELVAAADPRGDPVAAADAHAWRASTLLELCRLDEADVDIARHAELVERAQQHRQLVHRDVLRATRAILEGDYAAGEAAAQAVLEWGDRAAAHGRPPGPHDAGFHAILTLTIRHERGELAQMAEALERRAAKMFMVTGWRVAAAWTQVQAGRPDAARAAMDELAADGYAALPRDVNFVPSLAMLAHVVEELGDPELAAPIEPLLAPYHDGWVVFGMGSSTLGPVAYGLGVLQLLQGRAHDALASLELALDRARAMRARPYIARSHAALARALEMRARSGDRERAADLAGRAAAAARELGMLRLQRELAGR